MTVRLSARISSAPTRQISVKFDFGSFYENLSRTQNLVKIVHKISGTLHEDPTEVVLFLLATLNLHKSALF